MGTRRWTGWIMGRIMGAWRACAGGEAGANRSGERGRIAVSRARIEVPQQLIEDFCRRHRIRRLSLFGSVLRDDFRPDSDVDVLVEFEPGFAPGLAFFGMEEELSGILRRKVDLNTPGFLSRHFRDEAIGSAEDKYVAA